MTDLDEQQQRERGEQRERAHAAREALIGKTVAARYVLRGLVGHGGMGAVYEAEHLGLGKRVAIKFVDPEFATDENIVARFAREARAMSSVESAHIVTVFDAGTEDGRPYLVMELLRGEDLGQRLRRMRRVPVNEAMHVIAQVLKGLARAHAAGIVHRDLKPDNVFLIRHDTDPLFSKIVDFGISKIERPRANTSPLALTGRGTVLGTPFYMSPEQAQSSSDVDARADLYSVGAILFECLTGRPPHTGESYEQVILSICMRDAPSVRSFNPNVSSEVSAFVARALTRDRSARFASAERMLAALHEVAPEERTRVPLDPPSQATLLSAENPALHATVLDGGSMRSSSPDPADEVSGATRLGVATLGAGSGPATDPMPEPPSMMVRDAAQERSTRPETPAAVARKVDATPKRAPEAAKRTKLSNGEPTRAEQGSDPGARASSSSAPIAKRPVGLALITAALATLMGVGATFFLISMLDKKPAGSQPQSTSTTMSASASSSAGVPTASAALSAPATNPVPIEPSGRATTSASAVISPGPAGSGKLGTIAPTRTAGGGATIPALPRPTSTKPLDINRDLP